MRVAFLLIRRQGSHFLLDVIEVNDIEILLISLHNYFMLIICVI